jgi:hypothetical protein
MKETAMQWLDAVPLHIAILLALTIGLAPFFPEPHVVEKLRMLKDGMLQRPLDIFDLLMHGAPWLLLLAKLAALGLSRSS